MSACVCAVLDADFFFPLYFDACAADGEQAIGGPQQGHRRLHGASCRQARVHGVLLWREGQVRYLLLSIWIPMICSFVFGFEVKICHVCAPCAGYGTASSLIQRRGSSFQSRCVVVGSVSSLGVFFWPRCHAVAALLFGIGYKIVTVSSSSTSPSSAPCLRLL
jgi:hypothetical protein